MIHLGRTNHRPRNLVTVQSPTKLRTDHGPIDSYSRHKWNLIQLWGFVHINVLPSTQAKKELLNDTFFVDIYDPVSLEAWDYPQELFKWSVVFALNIL